MKKIITTLLLLLTIMSSAQAATYYMATTGSNGSSGTEVSPWLTLAYSMAHMSGGDTLIIEDGTYTGDTNRINVYAGQVPPTGSAGAYTIIKARNDGGVTLDGENTRTPFYVVGSPTNYYWQFEGIIFSRSSEDSVHLRQAGYVKFLRCGAWGAPAGNYATFNLSHDSYILLENCYSWGGSGRYKFLAYQSDHIIYRTCVGRYDDVDAGGQPAAVFAMYATDYGEVQNCIAIDADQTAHWTNVGDRQGCFFTPSTDGYTTYINFINCIGLNVKLGGIQTAHGSYDSSDVVFSNLAIWDCDDSGTMHSMIRGSSNTMNHCTFGMSTTSTSFLYADGDNTTLANSIIYSFAGTGGLLDDVETQDYNCYYGNNNTNGRTGTHDLTTINPLTNSLLYITRIEDGSSLDGAGESGSDIGANIKTLIGTPGTLYGETGYATDTGVPMWPFPNEDLIKTKMAAYNNGGVSGARGFCAGNSIDGTPQTLTKYIWEYLGNQIPSGIYGALNYKTGAGSITSKSGSGSVTFK